MPDLDHDQTATHYQTLLGPIYAWMLGDLNLARQAATAELRRLGIGAASGAGRRALDLGAGLGLHAVPLAALGYQVTAIDSSASLLAELGRARPDIVTVGGDLVAAPDLVTGPFDVIVCLGDTLTHLPSPAEVDRALIAACRLLAPDGTLAIMFRDYARARHGRERFFLVRGDDQRILTCCLDFEEARVAVTDILHERTGAHWSLRASTYYKLRLTAASIETRLQRLGLTIVPNDEAAGWVTIVAHGAAARP